MPNRAEMLKAFIQQRPDDPFPKYALALEYRNAGALADASALFETLMAAHPDYTATYLHAGQTLVSLGRRDEARRVFEAGVAACGRAGDTHARGELEGALASLGG